LIDQADGGTVGGMHRFVNMENLVGNAQAELFWLVGGSLSGSIDGALGTNWLIGDHLPGTYVVDGPNSGQATGVTGGFMNISSIQGGTSSDQFTVTDTGSLDGFLFGSDGDDMFHITPAVGSSLSVSGGLGQDTLVVDPGVGTARKIVYVHMGGQDYLAPDNGLLGRLAALVPPSKIIAVTNRQVWLPEVSATFHGRDIMAPVAARLSLGLDPDTLGPHQRELLPLAWPEVRMLANRIDGEVVSIDSFGNLITNITAEMLEGVPVDDSVAVQCDGHETQGIFTAYGDQPEMTLIALVGSSGLLEMAIVGDSAAAMLAAGEGARVTIVW